MPGNARKKWVGAVKTESTDPPRDLFRTRAAAIVGRLASRKASPKGPQSGMPMANFLGIVREGD